MEDAVIFLRTFGNMNTKFSEGKRLCLDHTDAWVVMDFLSFCRKGDGNIEQTHDQVSDRLCLPLTSPEIQYQAIATKNRKSTQER